MEQILLVFLKTFRERTPPLLHPDQSIILLLPGPSRAKVIITADDFVTVAGNGIPCSFAN